MKKVIFTVGLVILLSMVQNQSANADIYGFTNAINAVGGAINAVNTSTRYTMSTYEYANRFLDRRQERLDRKRAEKEYSQDAKAEYYKTLQEAQKLESQTNSEL